MFLLNALHKWAAEDAVAFQEREENQSHYITCVTYEHTRAQIHVSGFV